MRHPHHAFAALFVAISLWLCPTVAASDADDPRPQLSEALTLLDQANTLAETDKDGALPLYRQAAAKIDQVRKENALHNAQLEHALGNAYLKAGERGHAVLAYRRALLLDPTDHSISETLNNARSAVGSQIAPSRTNRVIHWLLAWRGSIPRSAAWATATAAFLLGWILITLRITVGTRPLTPAAACCFAASLLLFGALGLDHWESQSLKAGVLLEPSITARTGPSNRIFDPAFQDPLDEGVEFVIVDERDGWSKIQLASNALGWIPTETIGLVNTTN